MVCLQHGEVRKDEMIVDGKKSTSNKSRQPCVHVAQQMVP
jgi:hypothetical protein